jgi:hypothetical protein
VNHPRFCCSKPHLSRWEFSEGVAFRVHRACCLAIQVSIAHVGVYTAP